MRPLFLSTLTLLFYITAGAQDLSTGRGESEKGAVKNENVSNDGNCPTVLENWVDDDFRDQVSFGLKFNSEATTCQSSVRSYQDYLKNKQRSANFSDASSLGNHFSDKFKEQIHSSYQQRFLKDCNFFAPFKSTAIQTRFYAASARIAAVNSPILDEVAYYDSVLPSSPSTLHGIECTPIFPENNKKCLNYRTHSQNCPKDPKNKKDRLQDLADKTRKNLILIEDLIAAHRSCLTKIAAEPGALAGRGYSLGAQTKIKSNCEPFLQAVELKKNETPWIRGEIFNKLTVKKGPDPRRYKFSTEYDLSNKNLENAITSQFSTNRKGLTDSYKINLENFRCLASSVNSDGASCDFKKIRTDLTRLPDLTQEGSILKNPKNAEAKTYLDAETCMLERGEDRAKTKETITDSGITALTLFAPVTRLLVGAVRAVNTANKVGRVIGKTTSRAERGLDIANGVLGATLTGVDLKHTYDSCSEETKLVVDLSNKSAVIAENICSDAKSDLSQAREKESNCVISALLSAPGVLPFAAAVPGLVRLAKKPAAAAANVINRSAKSAKRVPLEDLKRNSNEIQKAVDSGQIEKAKKMITEDMLSAGHPLDDKQALAIIRAHTDEGAACIVGKCTAAQLARKTDIMKAAGLSDTARRTAIERGWAGRPGEHLVVNGNIQTSGKLTQEQVAQRHTEIGLQKVDGSSHNPDKARAMIAEFSAAAKAEREAVALSYASGGKEATAVVKFDLLYKDFSSSQSAIRRVRGGEHADLAADISNVSEHISMLKGSSVGTVAGKEYDLLIQRELAAMSRESQHSLNLSRNKDYPVGVFEAWQFMRARVELVRHNMNNGKMSEDFYDKISDELTDFVQKNKLQKQVEIWQKAEFNLRHN